MSNLTRRLRRSTFFYGNNLIQSAFPWSFAVAVACEGIKMAMERSKSLIWSAFYIERLLYSCKLKSIRYNKQYLDGITVARHSLRESRTINEFGLNLETRKSNKVNAIESLSKVVEKFNILPIVTVILTLTFKAFKIVQNFNFSSGIRVFKMQESTPFRRLALITVEEWHTMQCTHPCLVRVKNTSMLTERL